MGCAVLARSPLDLQGWHPLKAARRLQELLKFESPQSDYCVRECGRRSEFAGLNGEDSASTIPATLLGRAGEVIEWKIRCAAVHESLPGKRPTDVGHSSIRCYGTARRSGARFPCLQPIP